MLTGIRDHGRDKSIKAIGSFWDRGRISFEYRGDVGKFVIDAAPGAEFNRASGTDGPRYERINLFYVFVDIIKNIADLFPGTRSRVGDLVGIGLGA